MSWLDISTYIIQNSRSVCGVTFIISVIVATMLATQTVGEYKEHGFKKFKPAFWFLFLVWLFFVIGSLAPTHDKILAVKIARIKNEAVSKENVTKGVETLEWIGKKLECKYLGCDGEKEK